MRMGVCGVCAWVGGGGGGLGGNWVALRVGGKGWEGAGVYMCVGGNGRVGRGWVGVSSLPLGRRDKLGAGREQAQAQVWVETKVGGAGVGRWGGMGWGALACPPGRRERLGTGRWGVGEVGSLVGSPEGGQQWRAANCPGPERS